MSLKITQQDRKRVKSTALIFGIIFIICALLAVVFMCMTPNAKQIKRLSENKEEIKEILAGFDGETYYLTSNNWIYELDAYTDQIIDGHNVTEEISEMIAKSGDKLLEDSLDQWQFHTIKTAT